MHARFHCHDPFDTPGRVLDAARLLDLRLDAMLVERAEGGGYRLNVTLAGGDPMRARVFLDRMERLLDLSLEDAGA